MNREKLTKVIIITSEAFPYGMAGTNRIISLCKGFNTNGLESEVLSFYKYGVPDDIVINPHKGIYEGIKFSNVFNSTIKNRYKSIRAFQDYFKSVLVFFFCLRVLNRSTLVIYYSHEMLPAVSVKLAKCIKGSTYIKEETEHPLVRLDGSNRLLRHLYIQLHYKLFDGLFVITQNLYDYFREELKIVKPIIIVPMVVDIDRFSNETKTNKNSIVFSGELDDKKEGLALLIRAFHEVLKTHPGYTLNLYGKAVDEQQENFYKSLISDLKIEHNVILQGYKIRDEMTDVFLDAKLFVFSRPPSLQATYGFSTKLGEYLATGKPVAATRIGEIEVFLKDRHNAFLCDPDIDSIAETICEILDDYDFALKIGKEGRNCSFEHFNNKTETRKVMEQIQSIYNLTYSKTGGN